jgi:hypothetical protein
MLIIRNVLCAWNNDQVNEFATRGKDALALNTKGNRAFKNMNQFVSAAESHTSTLLLPQALLANWVVCCLQNCASLNAVAASAASTWICLEDKAVILLADALMSLGKPI